MSTRELGVEAEQEVVTLVYNEEQELTANRHALTESGFYFRTLLEGPFKEAQQKRINMAIDFFSFEVFKGLVGFAERQYFDNQRDYKYYFELIQMARMYLIEGLVRKLEGQLMSFVDLSTICTVHFLAIKLELPDLLKYCETYGKVLRLGKPIPAKTVLCCFDGHRKHHYLYCSQPDPYIEIKEDPNEWSRGWYHPPVLTEDEAEALAEQRARTHSDNLIIRRKIKRMNQYYSSQCRNK